MTSLIEHLNGVDQCLRATTDQNTFNAWFAGSTFSRGRTNNNINLLKSIFQGYYSFIIDMINKSDLTEEQKAFEIQKLSVFSELIYSACNIFQNQPNHGDNMYFLTFLSAYVNNVIRQNHEN